MASLDDIQTTIQSINGTLNSQVDAYLKLVPSLTSGTVNASRIIQVGFVRVTGVSVVVGGAAGALHDVSALGDIAAGNLQYVVGTTLGYYPMNIVFPKGLAYAPGAGQSAVILYTRI